MSSGWSRLYLVGKDIQLIDSPASPRFGAIFLHGIGLETLAGNRAFTAELAKRNLACVCPHGQRGWWLDRIAAEFDSKLTPERFVVEHVVPFARSRWNLGPRAL